MRYDCSVGTLYSDFLKNSLKDTYPWWPAVIWEEDDPGIPKAVLKGGKAARRRRTEPLSLVQFYDKASSW